MNEDDIRTGNITHIEIGEEDDVAWGNFDDGGTFDLPVAKDIHTIDDRVRLTTVPDCERAEIGADFIITIFGFQYATVYWCDTSPEGMEIVNQHIFTRTIH